MDWLIVVSLMACGCLLILLEIAIMPGAVFPGVMGMVLLMAGVAFGFVRLEWKGGWTALGIATLSLSALVYVALRANTWKGISLRKTSSGRIEKNLEALAVGDEGTAVSALRPFGKMELKNRIYEVKTHGEFVHTGERLQIIALSSNQIIVKSVQPQIA